jgi:MinD superfamily P-loop ATPase
MYSTEKKFDLHHEMMRNSDFRKCPDKCHDSVQTMLEYGTEFLNRTACHPCTADLARARHKSKELERKVAGV